MRFISAFIDRTLKRFNEVLIYFTIFILFILFTGLSANLIGASIASHIISAQPLNICIEAAKNEAISFKTISSNTDFNKGKIKVILSDKIKKHKACSIIISKNKSTLQTLSNKAEIGIIQTDFINSFKVPENKTITFNDLNDIMDVKIQNDNNIYIGVALNMSEMQKTKVMIKIIEIITLL